MVSYYTFKSKNIHPERITRLDKKLTDGPDYERIGFPLSKKDFSKIEVKNRICVNVFCYEKKLTYPIFLFEQQFKDSMDLLLHIRSLCINQRF